MNSSQTKCAAESTVQATPSGPRGRILAWPRAEDVADRVRDWKPSVRLVRPAAIGDGVLRLTEAQERRAVDLYDASLACREVSKFIAASGAASRMFEPLQRFRRWRSGESADSSRGEVDYQQSQDWLPRLPFPVNHDGSVDPALSVSPKALLPFHRYADGSERTPAEEHVREFLSYGLRPDLSLHVHFTTQPDHAAAMEQHLAWLRRRLTDTPTRLRLDQSPQGQSSLTLAIGPNGQPLLDQDGNIVRKPAGHGALLPNLDALAGDIVFVRTIDNVVREEYQALVIKYKKVIAGYLLAMESMAHGFLRQLCDHTGSEEDILRIRRAAESYLFIRFPKLFAGMSLRDQSQLLFQKLNRPIRVCAVVRRCGQPGGAPFWTRTNGTEQLRIVDLPEVAVSDPTQAGVWNKAAFFNPADLVCSVRDFQGRPFLLSQYSDPSADFIVERDHLGERVRILERPGLWNGGMQDWTTILIEVPGETQQPVKHVFDLLSDLHQPKRSSL